MWPIRVPALIYPRVLEPAFAQRAGEGLITVPDLYLREVSAGLAVSEHVENTLREAVEAYRHGLYLAGGVMLGSAREGAWLELTRAFAEHRQNDAKKVAKEVESPMPQMARLQQHTDIVLPTLPRDFRELGLSAEDLYSRAEYLRMLRNYSHPDVVKLPVPDCEGMGMALLANRKYFRVIYELRNRIRNGD